MRIHSIEVAGFGRFVEPARFHLAPDRPNLLAGPNGSGKSTLLAALSAAFVIPHRSQRDDIEQWRPWGRYVAPRVMVEFEHGGHRYRLTKVFLTGASAVLEREEAEGYRRILEGDAVEQELTSFLGGARRSAVDARARQWLLAGLLWVPQNRLLNTEVEGPVQESVRAVLGAQIQSRELGRVLGEVKRLYGRDWTPTGQLSRNSILPGLENEIRTLENELAPLCARLDELGRIREELAKLEQERDKQGKECADWEAELARLGEEADRKTQLDATLAALRLKKDAAEAEYGRLQGILQARMTLARQLAEVQERLAGLERERLEADAQARQCEEAFTDVMTALRARLAGMEQSLVRLNAPPHEAMQRLEELARVRSQLETKLESALLHAEIIPEADGQVEVLEGEPRGLVQLKGSEAARISGSPRIELRIAGFGRLLLTGPAESAAALRLQLDELAEEWTRLVAPFGEAGLEPLRQRRQQEDALLADLAQWRQALRQHEEGRSAEAVARQAARQRLADVDRQIGDQRRLLEQLEQETRRIAAETRTDAEIQQRVNALALEIHGLNEQIRAVEKDLSAFPPDLDARLAGARRRLEYAQGRLGETGQALEQKRLQMAALQGQAIYSAIAEKQALLEQKKRQFERAKLEADAHRLLKQALDEVQLEIQQQVLPRLEENALGILREITGGFADRLALSVQSWSPQRIRPAGVGQDVDAERISGGEQEQVHLAVRLAMADLLTAKEPFPVVLDDALLATDDERLERILRLLGQRRERVQWLILTCHRERFADGIPDAHVIELGARNAAA